MKKYRVIFSAQAEEQLAALYHHIAATASTNTIMHYTDAIVSYCEGLSLIMLLSGFYFDKRKFP